MHLQDLAAKVSLGPDTTIIAVFIGVMMYGMLLGQNKVKTLALSVYVGIVISSQLGDSLVNLISHNGTHISSGFIKLALFVAPMIILEFGRRKHAKGGGHSGFLMTVILTVVTSALVVSNGIWLLGPDSVKQITGESSLALLVYKTRLWWVALTPLAVIGENFIKPKEHY